MAAATANPAAPKRRTRKRKRRASISSSSSSSDSSDSDDAPPPPKPLPKVAAPVESSDSEDSSSSSSSSSDSDSDAPAPSKMAGVTADPAKSQRPRRTPSPSPPPAEIPSFIPATELSPGSSEDELKSKFRNFWMATVADGFRDDLEEIRKESNLGKSRLEMLIDSLASGTEVFSTHEMEIAMSSGDRQ